MNRDFVVKVFWPQSSFLSNACLDFRPTSPNSPYRISTCTFMDWWVCTGPRGSLAAADCHRSSPTMKTVLCLVSINVNAKSQAARGHRSIKGSISVKPNCFELFCFTVEFRYFLHLVPTPGAGIVLSWLRPVGSDFHWAWRILQAQWEEKRIVWLETHKFSFVELRLRILRSQFAACIMDREMQRMNEWMNERYCMLIVSLKRPFF